MVDRGFTEVDLRAMMQSAVSLQEAGQPGRWIVMTKHESRPWHVIVEPDTAERVLVVITAYRVDEP